MILPLARILIPLPKNVCYKIDWENPHSFRPKPLAFRRPEGFKPQMVRRSKGIKPLTVRRSEGVKPLTVRRSEGVKPQKVRRSEGVKPQKVRRPKGVTLGIFLKEISKILVKRSSLELLVLLLMNIYFLAEFVMCFAIVSS